MKMLFPLLTSLEICTVTALSSYSLSVSESSSLADNYYTTRNLITSSWTPSKIKVFKKQIHQEACSFGETRTLLANDVILRYRFWTPDGQLIKTWFLASSAVTCNSIESLPIQVINHSQEHPKNPPVTQPSQPNQPIGNLQLGMIAIVFATIITAIARSRQLTLVTQRKPLTANLKVTNSCGKVNYSSLHFEKVEMFNFCSSNQSKIQRKIGELSQKETHNSSLLPKIEVVQSSCIEKEQSVPLSQK